MKKRLLPIALMAVLVLGGCAQNDNTGGGGDTGPQIEIPVLSKVEITNKEALQSEWHAEDLNDATRKVTIACTPANNVELLIKAGAITITSSNTDVITVKGRVLTPHAAGTTKITVTFKNTAENITLTDDVDITVLERLPDVLSLDTVNRFITSGRIEKGYKLKSYGKIVAHHKYVDGHIHSGVFVQDGDDGAMLYGGQLGALMLGESKKETNFKIGDEVYFEAEFKPYNGLREFAPSVLRKLTAEDAKTITAPTVTTLTAETYVNETLEAHQATLVEIKGLKYDEGLITDMHEHNIIKFHIGEGEAAKPVYLGLNYHIGEEELTKINTALSTIDPAGSTIDLKGILSWGEITEDENAPQISLVYTDGKLPSDGITVHNPKKAPTAITIEGKHEVKATQTIKLTAKVTPEDASTGVIWSVDDDTIATIDNLGNLTGVKEGKVKVTATSAVASTVKSAEFEVEVKPAPVTNGPKVLDWNDAKDNPVKEGFYKLGIKFKEGNTGFATGALTGTAPKTKLATTASYKDGATFEVRKDGTDTYKLLLNEQVVGVKRKLQSGQTDRYDNGIVLDEADGDLVLNVWKYDYTNKGFYVEFGTGDHDTLYLAAPDFKDQDSIGPNPKAYVSTSHRALAYDYAVLPGQAEGIAAGEYYLGMYQGKQEAHRWLTGETTSNGLQTDKYANNCVPVTVAKVGEQYTVKVGEKYLAMYDKADTYAGVKYDNEPCNFDWDATLKTFTYKHTKNNKVYAMGVPSDKFWSDISTVEAKAGTGFFAALYNLPEFPDVIHVDLQLPNEISAGETADADVSYAPRCANPEIVWASSDPTVAKVENGKVTALKAGTTTIKATVKDTEIYDEVTITVKAAFVGTKLDDKNLLPAGYAADSTKTIDGVTFVAHQIYVGTGKTYAGMQMKKAAASGKKAAVNSAIYNTTATAKAIKSIELTAYTGKEIKDLDIYFGTESCADLTTGATTLASGTLTIDAPEGMTFFKIAAKVSSTSFIASIKITFVE